MDKSLRNSLRSVVVACRQVLEKEVQRQLESTFGITPKGEILEGFTTGAGRFQAAEREAIIASILHIESNATPRKEAVEQFARETAFTILNRLAAIKLMEDGARGLVQQSIARGKESKGFLLFQKVSPEVCRAATNADVTDGGYRLYLEFLFDDLATELGVLFDRRQPQSIIFPSDGCLRQITDMLNAPEIAEVWGEDETIGWIYQYFTPKEIRDRARKESQSPRNSYELAFRNQFYTPRYVVRFLVDNTLGRLWYEMRKGRTRLKQICKYMVYHPSDLFLGEGQSSPALQERNGAGRLDEPSPIIYRGAKDPRSIRLLDPACGSGHFLLYGYDLLAAVYEEAWEDESGPPFSETGKNLREDYPELERLRLELPGLILRYNLYGIDIDLRATQIAALALWLRAQAHFQELGLKITARPRITRSNIVCAEPMPGERPLLEEFAATVEPNFLSELVGRVFEKMSLAGEAGSLLKIEEEIGDAISKARSQWIAGPRHEQLNLFGEGGGARAQQMGLFDTSGITTERFWNEAEGRVLEALRRYSEMAANGETVTRRLFADDAAQGFAFVDLCRKRFDVVLMNPPFGEASKPAKPYIEKAYPRTKNDIYSAFVERGLELLEPSGMLGAITSRTGFFLSSFQKWREEILLNEARPTVVADLGYGVLDTAMVETAAYCLVKEG